MKIHHGRFIKCYMRKEVAINKRRTRLRLVHTFSLSVFLLPVWELLILGWMVAC